MPPPSSKPSVLFAMRYPDDTGYVWNYIAGVRDRAGGYLSSAATPYITFPKLTGQPSYRPQHLQAVELDCYDNSTAGRAALAEFVRSHNVKAIVYMSALPQTVPLDLLRRLGVKTLNTEDNGFDPDQKDGLPKRSVKYLMRRVLKRQVHDLHLANSVAQRKFLLSYSKLPPKRVVLMKNSVDCSHFCPGDQQVARMQTGLAMDRFWIIAVAQARPEKRIERLIGLMRDIVDARPGVRLGFVYVGDGPPVAAYKRQAAELGLQDVCVFAGRQDDVRPYFRASDLMVHASELESFGLAVVEAMACGLPVVSSAAAGPKETILDGRTGALVPLHDFECFRQAILRYIDDRAMTKAHGANARKHVDASYNVVHHSKEFAEHIACFL